MVFSSASCRGRMRRQFSVFLYVGTFVVFFGKATAAESSVKDLLEAYDHEFFSSYTLKLLASQAITGYDQTQGVCTATVTVCGNGREHALIWNRTVMDRLHYRPGVNEYLGASRTYQRKNESYRVNTRRKWVLYLGTQQWMRRFDDEDVFVAPDNSVSSTSTKHPMIIIGAFGDKDNGSYFYRHILPLGRGYAQFLDKITSAVVDGQGIALVVAHGRSFPPKGGIWNLEIATNQGYLVRHAEFTPYGLVQPSIVCESNGYWDGPIPLATRGSWVLAGYKVSVSLVGYSHQCDMRVLEAATAETDSANWPKGTSALDWRVVDGDGIPKRVVKR